MNIILVLTLKINKAKEGQFYWELIFEIIPNESLENGDGVGLC